MTLQVWSNNMLIISRGELIRVKLTPNIRNNSVHVGATKFCQVPPSQTHWASVTEREKGGKTYEKGKIQANLPIILA